MVKTMLAKIKMHIAKLYNKQRGLLMLLFVLSILLRAGVAFYKGDQVPSPPMAPDDTSYILLPG